MSCQNPTCVRGLLLSKDRDSTRDLCVAWVRTGKDGWWLWKWKEGKNFQIKFRLLATYFVTRLNAYNNLCPGLKIQWRAVARIPGPILLHINEIDDIQGGNEVDWRRNAATKLYHSFLWFLESLFPKHAAFPLNTFWPGIGLEARTFVISALDRHTVGDKYKPGYFSDLVTGLILGCRPF